MQFKTLNKVQNHLTKTSQFSPLDPLVLLEEPVQIVSYFLRNQHMRPDLAETVLSHSDHDPTDETVLEMLRSLIAVGKTEEAQIILNSLTIEFLKKYQYSQSEFDLEQGRILLAHGQLDSVIRLCEATLSLKNVAPETRMTLLQIKAHALIDSNQIKEAITTIELGLGLSKIFPFAGSALSLYRFLVKAQILNGNVRQAQRVYDHLLIMVDRLPKEMRWLDKRLITLRAQADLERAKNHDPGQTLILSRRIAEFLNDNITADKCQSELDLLQSDSHILPYYENIKIVIIPGFFVILDKLDTQIHYYGDSQINSKIIEALIQKSHDHESLFTHVWGIRYSKERHHQHVRMAISKLRRHFPKDSLRVRDGVISL